MNIRLILFRRGKVLFRRHGARKTHPAAGPRLPWQWSLGWTPAHSIDTARVKYRPAGRAARENVALKDPVLACIE
jgi:hypothetical protein